MPRHDRATTKPKRKQRKGSGKRGKQRGQVGRTKRAGS